jgi:hypothetical protein
MKHYETLKLLYHHVPITHKQSAEHTHTELESEEFDHVKRPWSSALVTLVLAEVSQELILLPRKGPLHTVSVRENVP